MKEISWKVPDCFTMLFHNVLFSHNDFNDWKNIVDTSYMSANLIMLYHMIKRVMVFFILSDY